MSRRRLDVAVGLAGASLAAIGSVALGEGLLGTLAAGACGGSLGLCRARPTAAWVIAAGTIAVVAPQGGGELLPFPLIMLSAFGAGRWAQRTSAIAGGLALGALSLVCAAVSGESWVPYVLVAGVGWIVGQAIRERQLVTDRLAERARELAQEQDAYAELSVRYERARIAAELHDIVAHAISVMVVQAGAGQRLAAANPELTAETFDAISGAARQAEADMGRLVALLADENAIGEAPDLELVQEIVARAAGTGLDVTLRLEGTREGLPADVVQAATRIVREGLTNALRYATGAPVRVLLCHERDAMIVEVANDPAPGSAALAGHGTGNGLRGLREHLDALGGQLQAGPTNDGGWRLRARLPTQLRASAQQGHSRALQGPLATTPSR
ncbi:MAG TPA: histidine kinase [Solirubrobacteraceae bacterium]